MQEEWRDVVGNSLYKISSHGRVKSFARYPDGRLLRAAPNSVGYPSASIPLKGKAQAVGIHTLVAEAFIGPRPQGCEVNHKDGNKLNNHVSNLEYLTNKQHKHHTNNILGKHRRGSRSNLTHLTPRQVLAIRELYATGEYTQEQIAAMFDIARSTISHLANFKTWKDESVPDNFNKPPNPLKKLNADAVRQIRAMYADGLCYSDIAQAFGVTCSPIGKIIRGESWKHVE